MVLNEKLLKIADISMSLQAASRSFMKMGSNSFNTQLLLATRTFCAAPPIAERIQVLALFHLQQVSRIPVTGGARRPTPS